MLEIEITQTNIIDGGVEVFARVWKDGEQIGFGKDGSVDIERFRIINPPVLVPDENGDVERITPVSELNPVERVTYYREDPEEALLQSLEGTIAVKKELFDSSKIVVGKVGNTTTTVYPSLDGWTWNDPAAASWSSIHDSATATYVDNTATFLAPLVQTATSGSNTKGILRSPMRFDTSDIGTDDISSATLSLWMLTGNSDALSAAKGTESTWSISKSTDIGSTIGTDDYGKVDGSSGAATEIATVIDFSDITTGEYNDLDFNAAGIAHINGSGYTSFSFRNWNWDGLDVDPNYASTKTDRQDCSSVDATGTTQNPKLVMEHAAGGGGTTYNALAMCNF